jgi:hypothetical protein
LVGFIFLLLLFGTWQSVDNSLLKAFVCPFMGNTEKTTVIPAKAGIHNPLERSLGSRFRGNDGGN